MAVRPISISASTDKTKVKTMPMTSGEILNIFIAVMAAKEAVPGRPAMPKDDISTEISSMRMVLKLNNWILLSGARAFVTAMAIIIMNVGHMEPQAFIPMVVPKEAVMFAVSLSTPFRFSSVSMVTGRVAPLDCVENAVMNAGSRLRKCAMEFSPIMPIK